MSFVATAFVWDGGVPLRYLATDAAATATAEAMLQRHPSFSIGGGERSLLGSPMAAGASQRGCGSPISSPCATTGRIVLPRFDSPRGELALSSTLLSIDGGGDGGGSPQQRRQLAASRAFASEQAAASHQHWYTDKRGMIRHYVQDLEERLALLEAEERQCRAARLGGAAVSAEDQQMTEALRLRRSLHSDDDDSPLSGAQRGDQKRLSRRDRDRQKAEAQLEQKRNDVNLRFERLAELKQQRRGESTSHCPHTSVNNKLQA